MRVFYRCPLFLDGQTQGVQGEDDILDIDLALPEQFSHSEDIRPQDAQETKSGEDDKPKKSEKRQDAPVEATKRKIEEVGELEFATFKDPKPRASYQTEDKRPVVEVKRAPAGTPVFSGVDEVTSSLGNTMFVGKHVSFSVFGKVWYSFDDLSLKNLAGTQISIVENFWG